MEPPLIVTGPVRPCGLKIVSRLEPFLTRLPGPLIRGDVPWAKVKLLVLELTVMTLGETVPLIVTMFETPTVSSNNTRSLVLNTVWALLLKLSQSVEVPVSQTPLAPPEFHFNELPVANRVKLAETLLVVPLLLPTTTL